MSSHPDNRTQAAFWNDYLKRDISFLSRPSAESFFSDLFAEYEAFLEPKRNGTFLEIGCGDGMDSIALAMKYGCHIVGIDISPRRIASARANVAKYGLGARVQAIEADAHSMPFSAAAFDVVMGNSVMLFLHHAVAVDEVRRVLKPGGLFLLSNESLALSPLAKLSRVLGLGVRSRELERYVVRRLSPRIIEELGEKYFARSSYALHYGYVMQSIWGLRLMWEKALGVLRPRNLYDKPQMKCPALVKKVDKYLIRKWRFYRDHAWIATVCFEK